ncbi:MAG: ACT domain-containing protein [Candidatus Anstonellales archaeon]
MQTITIVAEDRVGLLSDISYILGKEKMNIESIATSTVGNTAVLLITVKDAKKASSILKKNGFNVLTEEAFVVQLEDKPGELHKVAKMLADNKINIKNVFVITKGGGKAILSVIVDRPRKAAKILKPYCLTTA